MNETPQYSTYSTPQLHDCLKNINKDVAPENYAALIEELRNRNDEPETLVSEPFFESRPKLVRNLKAVFCVL